MNKRVLLLSAAALALTAGQSSFNQAFATDYSTNQTSALATSSVGDIHLLSGGGISVKLGSAAATLNSNNAVTLDAGSTISNADISSAVGVLVDAGTNPTGSVTSAGAISLSASGTGKNGILVSGAGTYTGPITLATGSSLSIVGDSSNGILINSNATMTGSITTAGTLSVTSSSSSSSVNSAINVVNIAGTLNGSVIFDTGTTITTAGTGSRGLVSTGTISGTVTNRGSIALAGLNTTVVSGNVYTSPESGSAFAIGGSVNGGIVNDGPTAPTTSTTMGTIKANGAVSAPVVLISPSVLTSAQTTAITIGPVSALDYSFKNYGTISSAPANTSTSAVTMQIAGASGFRTNLSGGIYNAGLLTAEVNAAAAVTNGTALLIDQYVDVSRITVDGSTISSTNSTLGAISAKITGSKGGVAKAIAIGANANVVPTINVQSGGKITADATTDDKTITALTAYAIQDLSGSVKNINNTGGTISATATALNNGAQVTRAIDLSANTTGVNIASLATSSNSANIVGDILFGTGAGNDNFTVTGNDATNTSKVTGAVAFGGGVDTLTVNNFATVSGVITSNGGLTGFVGTGGTLTLQNALTRLNMAGLTVQNGATLNLGVSSALQTLGTISSTGAINIADGATIGTSYNSFVSTSGTYLLLNAPGGGLAVSQAQLNSMNAALVSPFLYAGSSFCTSNVAGTTNLCADGSGQSRLYLSVQAKTAAQLGLVGHAAQFYTQAVPALALDPALGAAIVGAVKSNADAQQIFEQFAPDVSGGTRAVALGITDQATGPVAARQRALRYFGNQNGDATLWGQEYALFIKDHGRNDRPGFKDHGWGFAVGADMGDARLGWYGVAFTFYTGDVSQGARGNTHNDTLWYMLTGYSDWRGKRGLFFDTNFNFGLVTVQSSRQFVAGALTRTATSSHDGLVGSAGLSTGRIMNFGGLVVTPKIALDALWLNEDGYTETGGGAGMNLKVGSSTTKSVRAFLGLDVSHTLDLDGITMLPELRMGYRYDLLNDPQKVTAEFVSVPGTSFSVTGPDPSRGNIVTGASISFSADEAWSAGISYDYIIGSNMVSQVGSFTLLGRI